MDQAGQSKIEHQNTSLTTILYNWMATLFAYQPDIYFQLDDYRRKIHLGFVSPEELQDHLLSAGILKVSVDRENPKKLFIRLDNDIFSQAKGKLWSVIVSRDGSELEFACADDDKPVSTQNALSLIH